MVDAPDAVQTCMAGLLPFISRTSNESCVRLTPVSSFAFFPRPRLPVHSRGTYSSCTCCCCKPYGIVPQERITLGSRSARFRRPSNEARVARRRLELLLNSVPHPFWCPLKRSETWCLRAWEARGARSTWFLASTRTQLRSHSTLCRSHLAA